VLLAQDALDDGSDILDIVNTLAKSRGKDCKSMPLQDQGPSLDFWTKVLQCLLSLWN